MRAKKSAAWLAVFCNEPAKDGSPYCAAHSAVAYREPPPRKDNGRRDSDNQETTILDLLQKAGYIKNDKDVVERHCTKTIIKGTPYTEIEIENKC